MDPILPSWLHAVDPCQVFMLLERLSPLKHNAIDLQLKQHNFIGLRNFPIRCSWVANLIKLLVEDAILLYRHELYKQNDARMSGLYSNSMTIVLTPIGLELSRAEKEAY